MQYKMVFSALLCGTLLAGCWGNKQPNIYTPPPEPAEQAVTYDFSCYVVGISDGDTLTCLDDNKQQIKIRLGQIDAPEKKQPFGNASKKFLSDLVFNQTIALDVNTTDRYGRTVAEIFVDGKNINKAMVAAGMAWAYVEYQKDAEYTILEDSAKAQRLGLWADPNPIYPSDFRRANRN